MKLLFSNKNLIDNMSLENILDSYYAVYKNHLSCLNNNSLGQIIKVEYSNFGFDSFDFICSICGCY